jgi:hypothetical protein
MQRLEVSGAVRRLYGSLGVKGLIYWALRYNSLVCNDVRTESTVFAGPVAKY